MTQELLLTKLRAFLAARDDLHIAELAMQLGPEDWAVVAPALAPDEIIALIHRLPADAVQDLLSQLSPYQAAGALGTLARPHAATLLEAMAPDDATDAIEALPETVADQILVQMDPADAAELRELLAYPSDSAGGLMTPAFVSIAPGLRAGQAVAALRRVAEDAETFSYVYVLDDDERLLGVLPLHRLLLAPEDRPVHQVMTTDLVKARPDDPAIAVARLLRDRNLLAVPVVAEDGTMLGIVTIDDASELLEVTLEDDYLRQAGTDAEAMERRSPVQIAGLRLPWLLGTMVIELGAGGVISHFDAVLQQVILLASFMPVISAISGNVGLQSAAIVVRGLDTGHVALSRWREQVSKELATTLLMAIVCGGVLGTVGAVWSGHPPFGVVVGVAMTCSMLTAGFMGTVIPMLSKQLGFDPATTAGPFETAFQDVVGFAVFLWLASLLEPLLT